LRRRRYDAAGVTPELQARLERKLTVDKLGLLKRAPDGRILPAEKVDLIRAVVVPLIPPFLLFFFIAVSAPQLMNLVLIEKMTRVSEVLLGSVTPFQLMLGKLLGSVAASLLMGVLYIAAGLVLALRMDALSWIPPSLVAWFLLFLVLSMLLYGSLCIAVGAACNDLKDAQNLMLPVIMPLILPVMLARSVLEAPDGSVATALTLFPPSSPMILLMRLGMHPGPPAWQVALAVAGILLATAGCVWAAGRIFRVGLLMQGKSASLAEMVRWAVRG